jgi:peptidylprolyl isomerase
LTVTGTVGEKPTIAVDKPVKVKNTRKDVLVTGTGDTAAKGAKVAFNYVIVNGRTGDELETSYVEGGGPVSLVLDKTQSQPVIVKNLIGTSVGSRVVIAIAPKEGFTENTQSTAIKKNDTLLFVVDLESARVPLARAAGEKVARVDGLPKVKLSKKGAPSIKIPKGDAPTDLVVQPLVVGSGPAVEVGQTVTVHYTGVIWDGAKPFDSSWARDLPADFTIGTGTVIAGWDEGLVGQTVGSQVLLVIPPDKGYGDAGQPDAGITGTDTLVFVIDILDAA